MVSVARPRTVDPAPVAPSFAPAPARGPLGDLVNHLVFRVEPERGLILGVTSAIDGEGKSTIAYQFAAGLSRYARAERPVLLMDCGQSSSPPEGRERRAMLRTHGARLQERSWETLQVDSTRAGGP